MELSGKELAAPIHEEIKKRAEILISKGITPTLAIITVGGEDAWFSYVSQKQKTGERLGIKTQVIHLEENEQDKLLETVEKLDKDPHVHGIIVQRPLPTSFDREKLMNLISPIKDVDGIKTNSNHIIPIVLAMEHFISQAYGVTAGMDLQKVLINQAICVVGKGETAGKPIIDWLKSIGVNPKVIDSKTENACDLLKSADIVVTGIGKSGVVKTECLKNGVLLIGIGIRKEDEKLRGDYEEEEIKNIAKFYTPTPGGVGPLNLAYLFKNVIDAAEKQELT